MLTGVRHTGDYPGRFSGGNTYLHRLPASIKLAAALMLSLAATQARAPSLVIGVLLLELALYLAARLDWSRTRRDFRIVLIQAPVVIALYLWRDGWSGLGTGTAFAARIGATMLPLLWLQRTTRANDLIDGLGRWLPRKLSFVIFTTLRFVPLLLRDAREIHALQILRGARVQPRQLLNPLNWNELAHSVAIPLLIRTVKISSEVSASARVRGIADCEERRWLSHTARSREITEGIGKR
ncbi:MAG: energy-coupling factor transporter transmembrane component T [Arenicellales bacterium]